MTLSDGVPHLSGETESTTIPLNDGDIHVCQDGPREAPALLLIHGSASSARWWGAMVPLLTGSHRVIRLDLLGSGRSDKPADRDYATPEQGRRVGEVLDRLGVEHAFVVGHSSGGLVATALAELRPELVDGLVLIGTGPGMDAFIAQESTAGIGPAQWPPTDEQIRLFASTGFSRADYPIPREFVDDLRGTPFPVFAATMQKPREYLEQRRIPDRLMGLGKPLLVIHGEDDRRWKPASAADYLAVPGARVELLPGVGHTPIMEDPPRTAELLLGFTATTGG